MHEKPPSSDQRPTATPNLETNVNKISKTLEKNGSKVVTNNLATEVEKLPITKNNQNEKVGKIEFKESCISK